MKKALVYLIILAVFIITIIIETVIIIDLKRNPPIPDGLIIRDTTYLPGKDSIVYRPGKEILKDTTIYSTDTLFKDVDTMAILRQYFALVIQRDSLTLQDSLGTIYTLDSVSRNEIIGRQWRANIRQKVITNTVIVPPKKVNQLYVGLETTFGSGVNTAGAGLLIKTKNDFIVGVSGGGVNFQSQWKWYIGGKMYWKIRLRK